MDEGLASLARAANFMQHTAHSVPPPPLSSSSTKIGIDRIAKLPVLQRLRYDYFYSSIDQAYFNDNEFLPVMNHLGYDVTKGIQRSTLSQIRKAMSERIGTPRRFSLAFIKKERRRLSENRKKIRFTIFQQNNLNTTTTTSSSSLPVSTNMLAIRTGDFVIAYSKVNKVLCRGRIIQDGPYHSESRGFLIAFDNESFRDEWCHDYDIKLAERHYGSNESVPVMTPGSIAHISASINEYIENAKIAVVNVIDLKDQNTEYTAPVLDTITRCVALILWMKKSVNISNCRPQDIESLTQQALAYVTGDLSNVTESDKLSIRRELQGAINQVFFFAHNDGSPPPAL